MPSSQRASRPRGRLSPITSASARYRAPWGRTAVRPTSPRGVHLPCPSTTTVRTVPAVPRVLTRAGSSAANPAGTAPKTGPRTVRSTVTTAPVRAATAVRAAAAATTRAVGGGGSYQNRGGSSGGYGGGSRGGYQGRRSGGAPRSPRSFAPSATEQALTAAELIEVAESTFAELGLPEELVAALERRGMTAPFAIQSRTLPDGIAGRDILGRARTGSGKTLGFGLPMLARLAAQKRRPHHRRPARSGPRADPRARHAGRRRAAPAGRLPRPAAVRGRRRRPLRPPDGGAAARDRHPHRHPGSSRGPHRPRRRLPRGGRRGRPRRGRPHGRPGLPAQRPRHPRGHQARRAADVLLRHARPRCRGPRDGLPDRPGVPRRAGRPRRRRAHGAPRVRGPPARQARRSSPRSASARRARSSSCAPSWAPSAWPTS